MHSVAVGIGHRKIAGDGIVVFAKSDLETLRGDVVVGNKTNGNGVAAAVVDTARTRRESADCRSALRSAVVYRQRGIADRVCQRAFHTDAIMAIRIDGMEGV